jgi:hypothetical protein
MAMTTGPPIATAAARTAAFSSRTENTMSKTFPSARARFQSRHADQTIAAATLPKTRKIPAPKRIACTGTSLPEGGGRTTHSPPRRTTRTHRTMLGRWRPSRARLDDRFAVGSVCWLGRQDDERHLGAPPLRIGRAFGVLDRCGPRLRRRVLEPSIWSLFALGSSGDTSTIYACHTTGHRGCVTMSITLVWKRCSVRSSTRSRRPSGRSSPGSRG